MPLLDAPIAAMLPASWEARLGANTIELMAGERCRGAAGQAALDHLAARLTDGVALPIPLTVEVSARKEINAFAAPGGHIVVLDGLLQAAVSADEVAGVLAHEITHSRQRHPTRTVIRQSGTAFLEQLLLGTDSGGLTHTLMLLSYTRQFEEEADAGAVGLLERAEIDTAPFAAFFTRMAAARRGDVMPAILVTHPPPGQRSAVVAAHRVTSPRPALGDEEWRSLRQICNKT